MVKLVSDFNQDGKPDNITFMIKRIKVHTLDALKDPAYRFPNNYGVEKYLELFSGLPFFINIQLRIQKSGRLSGGQFHKVKLLH